MNKREALLKAKSMWGWTGGAYRMSNPNRNLRFMVGFIRDYDGEEPALIVAGQGESYEAAFLEAEQNPDAQKQQEAVKPKVNKES